MSLSRGPVCVECRYREAQFQRRRALRSCAAGPEQPSVYRFRIADPAHLAPKFVQSGRMGRIACKVVHLTRIGLQIEKLWHQSRIFDQFHPSPAQHEHPGRRARRVILREYGAVRFVSATDQFKQRPSGKIVWTVSACGIQNGREDVDQAYSVLRNGALQKPPAPGG